MYFYAARVMHFWSGVDTGEGAEITNYRVQGQRYLVDRLFDRAELRLGTRSPTIVRIDREGARR